MQQKEHTKFAFIIGGSMVKDIDGFLLTGSIKRKFESATFFIDKNGGHTGLY